MMNGQSTRPTSGNGNEIHDIPGPFHPEAVDLTETTDETPNDDAAQ